MEVPEENVLRETDDDSVYNIFVQKIRQIQNSLWELLDTYSFIRSIRHINREYFRFPFYQKKLEKGFYFTTYPDLKEDPELFKKYFRMDDETFSYLLYLTEPFFNILKNRVDGVNAEERLIITIRYLASGDQIFSLAVSHRVAESTIRNVIISTCKTINDALQELLLSAPSKFGWRNIAKGFERVWNLNNCIGAVDGKHIAIEAPPNSGTVYFNYKKFYSIILLAICDHKYKFLCIDVGAFGSESDGGVFSRSQIGKSFEDGSLNIPLETPTLTNSNIETPYYLIGDEAFRMTVNMMRPYPGRYLSDEKRICNYRFSRGRRCIENAFGILAARWRILNTRIEFNPDDVRTLVIFCVCLHNFLLSRSTSARNDYCPKNFTDRVNEDGSVFAGEWRNEVTRMDGIENNEVPHEVMTDAQVMRDTLAAYFMSEAGQVPWQRDYVNLGRYRDDGN